MELIRRTDLVMMRSFPVIILLCLLSVKGLSQYNGYIPGDHYIEFGAGSTVFQNSRISNVSDTRPSLFFYGEFGKYANPFSLAAGYDFFTVYEIGSFELKPTYAFLHLKVNLKRMQLGGNTLRWFGFLGPAFERTTLAVRSTNQVLVNASEVKMGSAFTYGLGVQYELGAFTLSARGVIYRSKRDFLAGGFEETTYETGSERILITIGFKIKQCESSNKKCSTYR